MEQVKVRQLCPELQLKAVEELNEVSERIFEDIRMLREWVEKQPHFKSRTDDQHLLSFLRGCKFSLEKAKQKLDAFYTSRSEFPEMFENRDPFLPEIQSLLKKGYDKLPKILIRIYVPLVNTEMPEAPLIIFVRNCKYEPGVDSFANIFKFFFMIMDILLHENDNFVVAGNLMLDDMENVTLNHYLIPPSLLQKTMTLYQTIYPLRVKGLYFIKIPSIFQICLNVLKPFMTEKLKSRIKYFTEETVSDLYKEVPLKCLPKEYGGDAGNMQDLIDEFRKKVESYAEWFKEDELFRTDESLRPEKSNTTKDSFGIEGSFRKLNVD